jgi:hypothetical protein
MSDIAARLKQGMGNEAADRVLLEDALREITELRVRRDALEEMMIILVRTGFPWDEEGTPGEAFAAFRERYQRVIHEASEMLGLELRSTINRTEPRT